MPPRRSSSSPRRLELLTPADLRTWHLLPKGAQVALRGIVRETLRVFRKRLRARPTPADRAMDRV
jgi:hypothetical protein